MQTTCQAHRKLQQELGDSHDSPESRVEGLQTGRLCDGRWAHARPWLRVIQSRIALFLCGQRPSRGIPERIVPITREPPYELRCLRDIAPTTRQATSLPRGGLPVDGASPRCRTPWSTRVATQLSVGRYYSHEPPRTTSAPRLKNSPNSGQISSLHIHKGVGRQLFRSSFK
jgi:hypothetical protein